MEFRQLKTENWMPYRGMQEIDFPTGDANIVVFFGENMNGKTSILNAVRWCLFGEVFNRTGKRLEDYDLINQSAFFDGESDVSVELKFVVDNAEYELRRSLHLSQTHSKKDVYLRIDNEEQPQDSIVHIIEQVVPKRLADFVFFDGEMLQKFEELIADQGGYAAKDITKNIELTLGLPILSSGEKLSQELARGYLKQKQKAEGIAEQEQNLYTRIGEQEEKIEEATQAITALNESIEDHQAKIAENRKKIGAATALSEEQGKKKGLEEALQMLENQRMDVLSDRRREMETAWQIGLKKAVEPIFRQKKEKLEEIDNKLHEQKTLQVNLENLKNSLDLGNCQVCDQQLSTSSAESINGQIEGIVELLKEKAVQLADAGKVRNEHDLLAPIMETNASAKAINKLDQSIIRLDTDIYKHRNDISKSEEYLKNHDVEAANLIVSQNEAMQKEIGRCQSKRQDQEKELRLAISARDNYAAQLKSLKTGGLSGATDIYQIANIVQSSFKRAKDKYVAIMKGRVEERATQSFRSMTTEKSFDCLEINESYGLRLYRDGREVPRSAGAEQIIALSLIEALNHLGRRKGPMFMDTPFGRLDLKHRKNIMNYIPNQVTQMVIFVHSGELLDNDPDLNMRKIGARYTIKRRDGKNSSVERMV